MPNYIPTSTMDGKNNNVPAATEGHQPEKAVINGGAKIKEKSLLEKARDQFIYEDGKSILETFVLDITVPALKNTIMSGATNALDMFLFGGNRQNNGGYYYGGNHYYGSNNYYSMNTRSNARQYYSNNYQSNSYQTQNPAKTSYGYDFTQVRYMDGEDPISHTFMTGRQRAGIVRDKIQEGIQEFSKDYWISRTGMSENEYASCRNKMMDLGLIVNLSNPDGVNTRRPGLFRFTIATQPQIFTAEEKKVKLPVLSSEIVILPSQTWQEVIVYTQGSR